MASINPYLLLNGKRLQPIVSFFTSFPPYSGNNPNEEWFICFEKNPDTTYCDSNHHYHVACLIEAFAEKIKQLSNILRKEDRRNVYNNTKVELRIQSNEKPSCPTCASFTQKSKILFNLGENTEILQ